MTLEGVEPDRRLSEIRCSWEHSGKVIAALPAFDTCPPGTDTMFTLKSDKDHTLCIDLDL